LAFQPNFTAVEYGDYECEYCVTAQCVIKPSGNLPLVFRNLPGSHMHHPNAQQTAEAAEAAAAQGHFWEIHNQLLEHQDQLDLRHLGVYAEGIGLDLTQLESDVVNPLLRQKAKHDFSGGARSRVRGTRPSLSTICATRRTPKDLNSIFEAVRNAARASCLNSKGVPPGREHASTQRTVASGSRNAPPDFYHHGR
jgi:hypothetical protein